jgi:alpha-mannosidase
MEKHPQLTLERIGRVVGELESAVWVEQRPLAVSVYQCQEPIAYDEALRQAYTPVAPGFAWGPVWSTAWFHVTGAVPAEWAGATVALLMDTGSEALVWQDGAPAQGLDPNRRDYVLPAHGAVDLYIEAACNHLFGIGGMDHATPCTLKTAAVARFNADAWDLYHDMRVLHDLAQRLPDDSGRRACLITALNEATNRYRAGRPLPEAREALAAEFAKPADASVSDVTAIGHSHIDTAWLWPLRETYRKCSRTFSTVLKYMETYPEYRYAQSQAQLYDFVKTRYPQLYARIKQAVAEGRWEPQGAMWVEADCNISSGESLVRQILYGTKFFREEFGVENNILWLPDVFGYSAALPQILQGCGIPYFMTQKISWSQFNKFPHHTFWWEGIDGTRVLTHFLPADNYNGFYSAEEIVRAEKNFKDKGRSDSWLYLFGWGDGGGGPTKEMLEAGRRMTNTEGLPRVTQEFAGTWFPRMEAQARDLRTWVGELYLELHRGTYTTQAKNKWENRRCELLLRDAEFLAAVHPGGIGDYPADDLETAWKLVLLNQFHDIIPGSSIHWVYEDSAQDYATVHAIGEGVTGKAMASFAAQIDTHALHNPLMVWNTLSFTRSGLVRMPWDGGDAVALTPKGQGLRTQRVDDGLLVEVVDAPSMGYVVYDLRDALPDGAGMLNSETVTADGRVLENEYVRVELNDLGEVTSFYDKQNEREVIAPGDVGNRFQLFDDTPNNYDAWDIDLFSEEVVTDVVAPATITVTESGPLRATLRVERAISPLASMVQHIRLESNSRRVDFETHIEWQESHKALKVAFPVDVLSGRATFDIQYGHVERPTHRNTSWDFARFEVAAHKWMDLAESDYGVALLNNGKYGHNAVGNILRLTLLRSPKHPDPIADMGRHAFTYSLLPHRGEVANSGVPLAGYDLNVPLLARHVPVQEGVLAQAHSYFRLDRPNLIIESVKRAEDGDGIIVRLYEAFHRRGDAQLIVNGLCSRATRTDLMERNGDELKVQGGGVRFAYRPFEIITLRLR